jgi:hypothetical protein
MRLLEEILKWQHKRFQCQRKCPPKSKPSSTRCWVALTAKTPALYNSAFGGDVVIVDGMAPYRWTGLNAQGRWFADAEEWAHDLGVTDENIVYDRIVHAEVVGAHAYVVLSATLFFALKGQRSSRRGLLTFTFAKQGKEWKIESQAWGRLS